MAKVSIVGAGQVGATCAYTLLKNNVADIVLIDVVDGLAKGKALDMMQAGAIEGYERKIIGTTGYLEAAGSDVIIITAGLARQPGMSRSDLLGKNAGILRSVLLNIVPEAPEALIIVVTNPVDVLAHFALKFTNYKPNRVIGMSGVLDSARYRYFIAQALDVPMSSVDGIVIGAHGDTMLPVASLTKVDGQPLTKLISHDKVREIIDKTRHGGAEIISYLKTGSAFYAPGASSARMADAILNDKKEVMPCSVLAQGEYGIEGIYIGLPVRLGRIGVEEIIEVPLTGAETEALHQSAASARNLLAELTDFNSLST
ncbi:MAG: malate dehydrogenase [Actinobacteria bacterium]|nr:malate dehydrogenase [Actinomycetota bacterium]